MRFTWSVLWIAIATLSPARLEKYMEGKDQFGTPNSGKQGYPNTPGGPTVSPIAHSAMKNNLRSYEFKKNFSAALITILLPFGGLSQFGTENMNDRI